MRAYYVPDGYSRHPKEICAVIEYSQDGMCLVMFTDGWTQWVTQRLVDVEA
jgi:hypothetical protein